MRKIIVLIILGIVTIGVVAWLAHYLSTGTIIINAGRSDTITLQKTSGGEPLTRIAIGFLSTNVQHGQYTATVKNGLKTAIQVINFKEGHKTFHYSIALANLLNAEPVAYETAQNLEPTSSQLVYLDGSVNMLYRIDSQNNLQNVDTQQFRVVKWGDSSFGVGQDSDDRLYTINGSSVSPLRVPFAYDDKPINFDVSPTKRIYVSHGADVYASSQAGDFKKIYTATSSKPALAAGVNSVAVSDSKYGGNASDISKPLLAIINTSGKKPQKNVEAERVVWSPDGQYLAVVNQASPVIYNTALKEVAVLPTTSVVGQFAWLNNKTLFFASSYQLWTYNLSDQKTQLLAGVPVTDSITGLYPTNNQSYVYVTSLNSTSLNYAIKRIGLKGQPIPDYISKLGGILPENLDQYSISMINFSSPPTILVQPYAGAAPGNYIQQAQAQLQSQGINTAPFRFELGSPSSVN